MKSNAIPSAEVPNELARNTIVVYSAPKDNGSAKAIPTIEVPPIDLTGDGMYCIYATLN